MAQGKQVRIRVNDNVWAAVEAVAKVRGVDPATVVGDALCLLLDAAPAIIESQNLAVEYAGVVLECRNIQRAIHDHIRVVRDYVVDARIAEESARIQASSSTR